jgi:hypothetical protein
MIGTFIMLTASLISCGVFPAKIAFNTSSGVDFANMISRPIAQ